MAIPEQLIEPMIRLELGGGLPPGYKVEDHDGDWRWVFTSASEVSQQSCGPEPAARAGAWGHFYLEQVGRIPPGYALVEEEAPGQDRHIWVHAEENVRSFPKASVDEAAAEAWVDFKAKAIGAQRPPHQEAGNDPRAHMARFQQASAELVGVHMQIEILEKQERALFLQMRKHIGAFNESMMALAKEQADGQG